MGLPKFWVVIAAGAILVAACAPVGQPPGSGAPGGDRSAQPKRLLVASGEASALLLDRLGGNGDVVEELVSAGLVRLRPTGEPLPLLAEAVPTLENGLLKVTPDGRMETTWQIKEGVKWQDGNPLTTDDLLFALRVGQDRDVPEFGNAAFQVLDQVRAVDARTIVAEWKSIYIQYDRMFSWRLALPLPKHLLEDAYVNSKETFTQLRFWRSGDFVHTGPYRVREFIPEERLSLQANPDFVLGRPKLDEVEVRFIPDLNTLVANVLAGEVKFTMGSAFQPVSAKQAAEAWTDGKVAAYPFQSVKAATPQFMNPDPPVQLDVRFRRALAHALDREALNDLINVGFAPPPAGFMVPVGAPEYPQIKDSIIEYPFDPRRSAQLIEELGYTRAGDFYRDAGGKDLSVSYLETRGGAPEQAALFVADSWHRVGVKTELDIRSRIDAEERSTRPGFVGNHGGNILMAEPRRLFEWFHGSQAPTAENRFRGNNRQRYVNAEFDALIDRFFVTLRPQDRIELLKQVARHASENVVLVITHHAVFAALINNRVEGVTPRTEFAQAWDSHLWDIR